MGCARQFLGWERPFILELARRLREEAGGSRELDEWLVWVPSARAGRHLRNGLFTGAAGDAEALHPPHVATPAQFMQALLAGVPAVASQAQALHAWKAVLAATDARQLEPLFPLLPRERKGAWAHAMARQLMALRARLAEDQWDFGRVACAPGLPADRARWEVLGRLEEAWLEWLRRRGLEDPERALAGRIAGPWANFRYRRVRVAGVLNLSPRQQAFLEALARAGVEVGILVPAPADRAGDFDEWGRPRPGVWDIEPLPQPLLEGRVRRGPEPRGLAGQVLDLAAEYGPDVDALVLGAPEAALERYLVERSRLTGTPFYSPQGQPLADTAWGRLLARLGQWEQDPPLNWMLELLLHEPVRRWAASRGIDLAQLEASVPWLQQNRLFTRVAQVRDPGLERCTHTGRVRAFADELQRLFGPGRQGPGFPERIWGILYQLASSASLDDPSRAILGQIEEVLQELQSDFDPADTTDTAYRELLGFLLEERRHYPERGAHERPVSGWLELAWETAPHVVVFGLPDAQVPGSHGAEAFLPPALCRGLDLYGPDQAAAFHACRLRLLLETRSRWGRADILLPDRGLDDAPVLPSRFLFLAGREFLLERVESLLGEQSVRERRLPARFGAVLRLPEPPPLTSVSATQLTAYLRGPFHCFLEHRMRWEAPEPLPAELDALAFGSLAHRVLEALNASPEGSRLTGLADISKFLDNQLDAALAAAHGARPGLPLRIQAAALRQRLAAAARVIAAQRGAGWMPCKAEWAFHKDVEFRIGGVPLRGVIDVLERNGETGVYRIVDYKTTDSAEQPVAAHLFKPNARSAPAPFPECEFTLEGKLHRWRNLQLPLYQAAVAQWAGAPPGCAYLCLAKAAGDVALHEWDPGPVAGPAAVACAEAIVGLVRRGWFPPGPATPYQDPWLQWFGGDYLETIDPAWRARHMEQPA